MVFFQCKVIFKQHHPFHNISVIPQCPHLKFIPCSSVVFSEVFKRYKFCFYPVHLECIFFSFNPCRFSECFLYRGNPDYICYLFESGLNIHFYLLSLLFMKKSCTIYAYSFFTSSVMYGSSVPEFRPRKPDRRHPVRRMNPLITSCPTSPHPGGPLRPHRFLRYRDPLRLPQIPSPVRLVFLLLTGYPALPFFLYTLSGESVTRPAFPLRPAYFDRLSSHRTPLPGLPPDFATGLPVTL